MVLLLFVTLWKSQHHLIASHNHSHNHNTQFLGGSVQFIDCDVHLYPSYQSEVNCSTKLFVWRIEKNYDLIVHFPKERSLLLYLNFLPYWELFLCRPFCELYLSPHELVWMTKKHHVSFLKQCSFSPSDTWKNKIEKLNSIGCIVKIA